MGDYIRRILIAAIMLLFISLLFIGGNIHKHNRSPYQNEQRPGLGQVKGS